MIKILFDFAPSDTPKDSENYKKDQACREELDYNVYVKYHYHDMFEHQYCITSGSSQEKIQKLQEVLEKIAQMYHGEIIYMHFLGHGVKNMIGLEFVRYEDLCNWLLPIKEHNDILLNMMSSCYTVGMTRYRKCYDILWYSVDEVQDYCASFDFIKYYLKKDGSANFEEFRNIMKIESLREDRTWTSSRENLQK